LVDDLAIETRHYGLVIGSPKKDLPSLLAAYLEAYVAAGLDRAPPEPPAREPPRPPEPSLVGATLDSGRFAIEGWLSGAGPFARFRAVDRTKGSPLLATMAPSPA